MKANASSLNPFIKSTERSGAQPRILHVPTRTNKQLPSPFQLFGLFLQTLSEHCKGYLNKMTGGRRVNSWTQFLCSQNTFNQYCIQGLDRVLKFVFLESIQILASTIKLNKDCLEVTEVV